MEMDKKMMSILDLNNDCLLEIMKYIIADCELNKKYPNPSKYEDIENFAMLHDNIKELLKMYHKEVYYHRELTKIASSWDLIVDFAHLPTTIASQDEGDAYWKLYSKAIRENRGVRYVEVMVDLASSYPEFPKHFQMIKCALENKKSLRSVKLALNGYTLDDLNNFGHLKYLYLDVRISAQALISVCKLSPLLKTLELRSTEISGRLSDLVPHCRQLEFLTFVPKPNVDGSEYAPLVQLPSLKEMTIHGAYKNGSLLTIFQAMKNCRRAKYNPLTVHFTETLPHLSNVTIVTSNSLQYFEFAKSPEGIQLKTSYNFYEISKDRRSLHQTLATITLIAANFGIDWRWRNLILDGCATSDITELISLLKLFDISSLTVEEYDDKETSIPKLFGSLIPDGLFALKSIIINPRIAKIDTFELVKIKSIRFLECGFSDWESIDILNQLTELQTLSINVDKQFEKTSSKALCNLLDTCQVCAFIKCKDWRIEFKKSQKVPFPSNGINTLKIFDVRRKGSLNELLEALANRNFNANDEVDISHLKYLHFKDIFKMSEIQTLKKLSISLADPTGIEKLSDMTELEELTIWHGKGSLIQLFNKLAMQESPSLQSLQVNSIDLSPEEIIKVSQIRSLKKLKFCGREYFAAWAELVNSDIEELTIETNSSLQKLFEAFAIRNTTRLQYLKIKQRNLNTLDLEEISKLNTLKSLHICDLSLENHKFLQKLQHLENLSILKFQGGVFELNLPTLKIFKIHRSISLTEFECLRELKNLESLALSTYWIEGLHVLADMKYLKELIIQKSRCLFSAQAFACKDGLKLEHLTVPIKYVQELIEVTSIKSLKSLHLCFQFVYDDSHQRQDGPFELGHLPQLESLYIKMKEGPIGSWLAILESCKNLERCTIECAYDSDENIVRNVKNILKTMRDPALQGPLILTVLFVLFDGFLEYSQMEHFDDDYLKTYYSFNEDM